MFQKPGDRIPKVALRWTGKRKRGRPKTTWWRIVMKELEELSLDLPQVDCVSAIGVRDARDVRESKRSP